MPAESVKSDAERVLASDGKDTSAGLFATPSSVGSTALDSVQIDPSDSGSELKRQLRHAARREELLSTAAQAFVTQLDRKALYVEIANQANRLLPVSGVVVYSNTEGELKPEAFAGNPLTTPQPNENVRWCVRYLKPRISNMPPRQQGLRNSICVPFVASQNRPLGVVEFQDKRTGGLFTMEDARLALCFARMATMALDRAKLFDRIEQWGKSLETLLSFNATVNQHLEPEDMVRELVSNVTEFLSAQGGMAGIVVDSEESMLETQADGFYFGGLWTDFSRKWKSGRGIPGTVIKTEFPYLSRDYKNDPLRETDLSRAFDLGSCICVPIKNPKEEVLGFFQLNRCSGEPEFTWQDAAFLESLGNNAAVAIENARLVQSLDVKTKQLKSLSEDHVRRLEQERQHIARELHDETGQVLIGLKLRLQVLGGLLSEQQSGAKAELAELRAQLNNATRQLKDLAKRLRPTTLDELGFEATLRELVSSFRRHAEFVVHLDIDSTLVLSKDEETALYRILQECLTNVAKHANATSVTINFHSIGSKHMLRICDDGDGFPQSSSLGGLGLVGIRERVAMLGADVQIRSEAGAGTTVEVILADRAAT